MFFRPAIVPTLAAMLLLVGAGCEPPVMRARMEVPRKTTQQVVRDMRTAPELRSLVVELSRDATYGAVEGLSDAETRTRLNALVSETSRAMLDEIAASMGGPKGREITAGITRTMLRSLSDELTASVGPAMREMIVDELLRNPELREALNETSHDVGRQVALGTAEAVTEAANREKSRGLLPIAADVVPTFAWLVIGLLLLALGIPLALLLRQRRAARRYREDVERRTAVAAALVKTAEAQHDDPQLRALLGRIAASLTAEPASTAAEGDVPASGTLRPA